MKINDRNTAGAAAAETARTQDTYKSNRTDSAQTGSSGSSDRVEFSSTLGGVSRAIACEGQQRAARVQALATAYQNGSYRPDSMAISRAMISETLSAGVS